MPPQTSKKTLVTTSSVLLDTLDPFSFYDVTLSGDGLIAGAHANLTRINSVLKGDTLRALGSNNTLTGGAGNDLLISSGVNNLLVAGTGSDTLVSGANGAGFLMANAAQLSANSISGGAGIDTLRLGAGIRAADSQFSRIRGVEVLSLGAGASVTLAGAARTAGISSVMTGEGGGTVQGASYNGSMTLEASGSGARAMLTGSATQANLFRVTTGALATSTLTGGARNDTLSILSGGSNQLSDTLFANLLRIDTLLLPGQASVTLGAGAQRSGFTSIIGSNDGVAIRQEPRQTRAMTLVGGAGADLFSFASTALAAANSIVGGGGLDTIRVDTGTMADTFFRRVSGIEVLSLGNRSSVTLGNTASSKGLQTVVAGASNVTVQAGAMGGSLTLDASSVAGRVLLAGSSGGSLFLLGDAADLTSSTLRGGGGLDTLSMRRAGSYTDSSFSRMRGIDVMQLAGSGNSVVLGSTAALSGLTTMISGSEGGDTITQNAGKFYLDASKATKGVYFNIASPTLFGNEEEDVPGTTIAGGSGIDTLVVGAGDFSGSSMFSNISGIEALFLTGGNGSLTLDENASALSTIIGSSGAMTFIQTEGSFVIDGRAGSSNLFDLSADGTLLLEDTIFGGSGVDSLFLGEAVFDEDPFTNVKSVEFVSLTGTSSIILGNAASGAGVSSLYGGEDGDSTIQVDAGAYYLNGSASSSNLFILSDASLVAENTIVGNSDSDTLAVGDGTLRDVDFGNLIGVGTLSLTGSEGNYLELGGNASEAGISAVYGGDGDLVVDLLKGGFDIEAGETDGTFFVKATDSGIMEESTFTGNGEDSTLAFWEGEVLDAAFANVKDVGTVLLEGSSSINLEDSAADAGIGTVLGGSGDTTFIQNAGSFVLDGSGSETNLFVLANASTLAANDTIIGGDGSDTLVIAEGDTLIGDSVFADISDVEILSLADSSNLTMGALAADAGITQVILGIDSLGEATGGDYRVNLLAGASDELLVDGSAAESVRVEFANASFAATTTLYGGVGDDTLAFGVGSVIEDETFANVRGFEVLSVTGGSSVTLGAAAADVRFDSILGGDGINTIIQDADNANALYISGGAGQLSVELDDISYLVNNTILGGTSTLGNTLSVKGDGNIFDSYFNNHERLQTLLLAGDNSVELGSAADAAGVTKVIVEDGDNSFTVLADGPSGVTLDASSGSGDNSFTFENADQLLTARVYGSDGEDTLSFVDEAAIGDTLFARVDSIEVLELGGASDVTLGTIADSAGLSTVIGGSGGTVFTQDSLSNNSYYLDGSASTEEGNTFVIGSAAQVADNTLIGGEGVDTVQVGEGAIEDDVFINHTSVEVLQLTGSSSVVLGANADNSGLQTVAGGSGNNIFTHTSSSESSYYFDGGNGISNLFSVADAVLSSNDTFVGGKGVDTLQIGEDVIDDTAFVNHESIEVLQLTGSSEVTLGESADDAGIVTVIGGAGSNTITQNVGYVSSFHLDGSEGTSNLFVISDTTSFTQGTILGGIGIDTVQVGEDVIGDAAFTNHRDLDVIQLTGTSDITVGEKADLAGISTVIGGEGSSTFTHLEKNYGILLDSRFFFDGSGSTNNLFVLNDASQLATDTLLGAEEDTLSGASGIDTLQIATADTILDTDFTNASSVEVLRLTGSSNVTIGEKADFTGITTVIGGVGSSTITHADKNYNALRLDGSNGSTNLFVIQDEAALGLDTIIGGNGNDTLRLATGVRFEDTLLGNVSDVELLQLSEFSDVTLASAAATSGISTIHGGSGATSLDASAMTGPLVINASAGSGTSFLLAGSGADTITGGSGADTLQGWATTGNSASDTLFGGGGADLFVLGNTTASAYGTSGSKALISDFAGGTDYLQLKDYGSGASSYRVDANAGSGYTHQLFDVSSGSDVLLANINYSGSDASGDLLGTKAIFA